MIIDTIVTDLDDTLLNGEGKISDYTLTVMRECLSLGIRVIPASGRTHASMYPFVTRLNTGLPYIACNGAELVNAEHKVISVINFDPDTAREISAFLEENGCYVQVYRDECFYYAQECEPAKRYKQSSGMKGVAVGDLCGFIDFEVPKVLCVNHSHEIERLYPIANARFAGRATFTMSKPYFLEAEPPGATKGEALVRLAAQIGIVPARTAVFGDSLNDMSMFAFTPHSVAMGNAREEVRRAAAHVCRSNTEDGMARFVEEYILAPYAKEGSPA